MILRRRCLHVGHNRSHPRMKYMMVPLYSLLFRERHPVAISCIRLDPVGVTNPG